MSQSDGQSNEVLSQSAWIDWLSSGGTSSGSEYQPDTSVIADHLDQFLRGAHEQTNHLSNDALKTVLWGIFGPAEEHFKCLLYDDNATDDQQRVYSAFTHFYTEELLSMFPNGFAIDSASAICSIWEIDEAGIPLWKPERWPHLIPAIESCFQAILCSKAHEPLWLGIFDELGNAIDEQPEISGMCRRLGEASGIHPRARKQLVALGR